MAAWALTLFLGLGAASSAMDSLDLCFANQITIDGFNDVDEQTKDANYDACVEQQHAAATQSRWLGWSTLVAGSIAVFVSFLPLIRKAGEENRASRAGQAASSDRAHTGA